MSLIEKQKFSGTKKDLQLLVGRVVNMHKKGYSNLAIAEKLDIPENAVRSFIEVYEIINSTE